VEKALWQQVLVISFKAFLCIILINRTSHPVQRKFGIKNSTFRHIKSSPDLTQSSHTSYRSTVSILSTNRRLEGPHPSFLASSSNHIEKTGLHYGFCCQNSSFWINKTPFYSLTDHYQRYPFIQSEKELSKRIKRFISSSYKHHCRFFVISN